MEIKKQFYEGLLTKNPVLVQLLGMCSTLAITTSLFNGVGMSVRSDHPDLLQHRYLRPAQGHSQPDPHRCLHHHHCGLRHRGGSAAEGILTRPV